jgi:hypothetical protein
LHQLLLQELEFDFQPEKPSSVVAISALCFSGCLITDSQQSTNLDGISSLEQRARPHELTNRKAEAVHPNMHESLTEFPVAHCKKGYCGFKPFRKVVPLKGHL